MRYWLHEGGYICSFSLCCQKPLPFIRLAFYSIHQQTAKTELDKAEKLQTGDVIKTKLQTQTVLIGKRRECAP